MARKLLKNKKARFFLVATKFLTLKTKKFFNPSKKLFRYFVRYWQKKTAKELLKYKLWLGIVQPRLKFSNLNLSFKPFSFLRGAAVFALTLCILFAAAWFVLPKPQIDQSQVIKTALTKQTSLAVAGKTVKWSVIVKKSDITSGQNLVQLPKSAKNIKVKTITKQEAENVLAKNISLAGSQLTTDERKQLTSSSDSFSSFIAGLLSQFSKLFLASIQQAVKDAIAQETEQITEIHPEIIETSDAVFVDLSILSSPEQEFLPAEPEEIQPEQPDGQQEQQENIEPIAEVLPEEIPAEEEIGISGAEIPEIIPSSDTEIIQLPDEPLVETISPSDQEVVVAEEAEKTPSFAEATEGQEYVEIDYETPSPKITEQETDKGKIVTISDSSPSSVDSGQEHLTDVLAYTTIPEIYKVGQENKIKIFWLTADPASAESSGEAKQEMEFYAFDLNENGKLDYVEWTVPHLSEQIFEIIFISKAFELDENKEIVADIYDLTYSQDNQWATIPQGHYVRATFEQILDNTKDNTIYARPVVGGTEPIIEVYPVYTDPDGNQTQGPLVATFESIDHEGMYGVLLTNLLTPTDVFDIRVTGGDVDIDWIVDPSNIAYGAEYVFSSNSTVSPSVVALSSTTFAVSYAYGAPAPKVYSKIGTVSNVNQIDYGAQAQVSTITTTNSDNTAIDSDDFALVYQATYGKSKIGALSGTTITFGDEKNIVAETLSYLSVSLLDSSHFVVAYRNEDWGGYAMAQVTSFSGSTIGDYGAQAPFDPTYTFFTDVAFVSVAALDSTHFVAVFVDLSDSSKGTAIIGNVSGTTISSYGTPVEFNIGDSVYTSVAKLDSTHFVVVYQDAGNLSYGTAVVGTVSGDAITFGDEYVFNSDTTYYTSVAALDSTHFVAAYKDGGNLSYGTALVGTVANGDEITFEDEAVFNLASTAYVSVAALDSTNFAVGYQDTGNSSYGTGIIGVYSGGTPPNTAPNAPTLVSPASASYTTDTTPTLSANYSDPDAGDVGTTNYRISSSSLADCVSNTNIVASGTSSETADENEDTTYTPGSSIGSDATYYWCAQNNDGVDTSSWTQMGSLILDTAVPVPTVTSVGGDTSPYSVFDTSPEILITLNENGDCYASETDESYDDMVTNLRTNCTGDGGTSITCQMGTLAESASKIIYVACKDTAGNKDTIATNEAITMEIDATPPTETITSVAGDSSVAYAGNDATPTLIFTTNETADCFASTDEDETYAQMSDDTDCTVGTSADHTCTLPDLGTDGAKTIYLACEDDTDVSANQDTTGTNTELTYTLDTTAPVPSSFSPASASTITDSTPTITFSLDENGDCKSSLTDQAYDSMTTDCAGDGTQSISCTISDLDADGSKNVYVACKDTVYSNKDTADTNENLTYTLDATAPSTTAGAGDYIFGGTSAGAVTVTLTCSDGSGSGCLSTLYCTDTVGTCTPTTNYSSSFSISAEGTTYVRFYSTDNAGLTETTNSETVKISFPTTPAGGGSGIGSSWSQQEPVQEQPAQPEEPEQIPDANILDKLTEQIDELAEKLNINNEIEEKIVFPPIEETVTQETPASMQKKWDLIQQKRFEEISILPLPDEIKQLALNFPSFQETLEKVGIEKIEDVEKLKVARLSFPGLAEALGRAVASINPADFNTEEKIKMPANFVFARLTEDKIDFNTKVSLTSEEEVIKSITTIQNKPLYLVVKPDKPARKVTGYIIFKSVSSESALQEFASGLSPALSASLLDAFTLPPAENQDKSAEQEVEAKKELVLNKFEYEDPDKDGIYTAAITSPAVSGKYEIKTIIEYKDDEQSSKELNMIMVVDPEGYVYEKTTDGKETRISKAVAAIYWLNPETKLYEAWPANDFQQENPQTTDNTGKYSFLVPAGYYYLEIKADGYIPYKGEPFEVQEGIGIHANIELKIANWWQRTFTIERIMLGLITVLLLAMLVVLTIIIFKKRKQISM